MRRPLIAGNWKMYKTTTEAVRFVKELVPKLTGLTHADVLVAPSYVHLRAVASELEGSGVYLAAQNLSDRDEGAFTGEVSGPMLVDAGCSHVIIGHSERRQYYGETDETVNARLQAAFRHGLKPILCIGETLEEREGGVTNDVIEKQLSRGLSGIEPGQAACLLVAYEPVWAIGTGRTASPEQAQEVHRHIRGRFGSLYGADLASGLGILYGGSVKPDNVKGLIAMADIDGALVGGACLAVESFQSIVFRTEEEYARI